LLSFFKLANKYNSEERLRKINTHDLSFVIEIKVNKILDNVYIFVDNERIILIKYKIKPLVNNITTPLPNLSAIILALIVFRSKLDDNCILHSVFGIDFLF